MLSLMLAAGRHADTVDVWARTAGLGGLFVAALSLSYTIHKDHQLRPVIRVDTKLDGPIQSVGPDGVSRVFQVILVRVRNLGGTPLELDDYLVICEPDCDVKGFIPESEAASALQTHGHWRVDAHGLYKLPIALAVTHPLKNVAVVRVSITEASGVEHLSEPFQVPVGYRPPVAATASQR